MNSIDSTLLSISVTFSSSIITTTSTRKRTGKKLDWSPDITVICLTARAVNARKIIVRICFLFMAVARTSTSGELQCKNSRFKATPQFVDDPASEIVIEDDTGWQNGATSNQNMKVVNAGRKHLECERFTKRLGFLIYRYLYIRRLHLSSRHLFFFCFFIRAKYITKDFIMARVSHRKVLIDCSNSSDNDIRWR